MELAMEAQEIIRQSAEPEKATIDYQTNQCAISRSTN